MSGILSLSYERLRYEHFRQELTVQNIASIQVPDYQARKADPFKPRGFADMVGDNATHSLGRRYAWSYVKDGEKNNHTVLYEEARTASQSATTQEQVTACAQSLLSMLQSALRIAG